MLLKNPRSMFTTRISLSVSVCALAIFGYRKSQKGKKRFSSPDDYLGYFKTSSITICHVKTFYSTSSTCITGGAGYDFTNWSRIKSTSNYRYCTFLNRYIEKMNKIYDYLYKKAKKIKP